MPEGNTIAGVSEVVVPQYDIWLGLGIVLGAALIGWLAQFVLSSLAARIVKSRGGPAARALVKYTRVPARLLLPPLAVQLVLPSAGLSPGLTESIGRAVGLVTILGLTWLAMAVVRTARDTIIARHNINIADNLDARRIHTQVGVLATSIIIVIGIVGVAIGLMTFPQVRQIGTSLLASAGIAGLAVGLAARPLITNLIAGVQIAFTEPIRVDDVLIVSNEWGRVEEITPTYVVLRIWDERRLIIPLGYFLEQPFQNWTRTSAQILGTVFLHVDYSAPVDEIRAELRRIVEESPLWDQRVCGLVVTETTERTMQLRALVSSRNSGDAWDLRCVVREKLVEFLQREHPTALPRVRAEIERARPEAAQAA